MAFHFTELPRRSQLLSETLGPSIGRGLGNMMNSYFANKALESVLGDKSLAEKPLSEKWNALESKLRNFGSLGQEMLQRRLGIEQQKLLEREQERSSLEKSEALKSRMALAEQLGVSPETARGLSAKDIIEAKKAMTPKAPPGGASFQPIPKETSDAMSNIIRENPDASASELELKLTEAGIPPGFIKTAVETRRRELELGEKKKETAGKKEIEIHKLSKDIDKEIAEKGRSAGRQLEAVNTIRQQLQTGKIKPTALGNMLRGFGRIGDKLADAFLTKEQAAFSASIPQLIEGMRDLFGVRLSDADLRIVKDKLPDLGKNVEANESILSVLEKYANISKKREEIGRQVKKENQGLRPVDYEDEVEERLDKWKKDQYGQEVQMFNSVPDPAQYKGRNITNPQTGQRLRSDGVKWNPV